MPIGLFAFSYNKNKDSCLFSDVTMYQAVCKAFHLQFPTEVLSFKEEKTGKQSGVRVWALEPTTGFASPSTL